MRFTRSAVVAIFIVTFASSAFAADPGAKKGAGKHSNINGALASLEQAKDALSRTQWDDEKGSRAKALSDVDAAVKEVSAALGAVGDAAPRLAAQSSGEQSDETLLLSAEKEIKSAREALNKAEGQDFKGHRAEAEKMTEEAGKSVEAAVASFKKEDSLRGENDKNYAKLSPAAAKTLKSANPDLLITKIDTKTYDDERGKVYVIDGRAHGHRVEIEIGDDGRIWSHKTTPRGKQG